MRSSGELATGPAAPEQSCLQRRMRTPAGGSATQLPSLPMLVPFPPRTYVSGLSGHQEVPSALVALHHIPPWLLEAISVF